MSPKFTRSSDLRVKGKEQGQELFTVSILMFLSCLDKKTWLVEAGFFWFWKFFIYFFLWWYEPTPEP